MHFAYLKYSIKKKKILWKNELLHGLNGQEKAKTNRKYGSQNNLFFLNNP